MGVHKFATLYTSGNIANNVAAAQGCPNFLAQLYKYCNLSDMKNFTSLNVISTFETCNV